MNIELISGKYKSIKSLIWKDIPAFVVITGKNGSGKTQLLELINHHFATTEEHKRNVIGHPSSPFYQVKLKTENCTLNHKEVVYLPSIWKLNDLGATNASHFTDIINNLHSCIVGTTRNEAYQELGHVVEARIGKPKQFVTKTMVQENLPVDYYDYINKIQIHEGLSEAFLAYHGKFAELRDEGRNEAQIESQIGRPPWDIINELLESVDFPYIVNRPRAYIGDYHFQLKSRKDQNLVINFSDLSSGEKVLISLSIWMFNTSKDRRLPKLLLLDEPDAHLHPSAIKEFIDVVERNLVKKHGVRVMLTTHSPTTVSFAPEYSLFEMSKEPPQIRPVHSKEYAINLLTDGLVVVKSNTKYVLVEDQHDAGFYNSIFSILRNKNQVNKNISVVFIPSSNKEAKTSGGHSTVKSWVEKFVKEGVFDVFQGLIDFDNGNTPLKNVHVIKRHSLENYLLDPILVFSSIIHEGLEFGISGLGIDHKNEHQISNLKEEKLQIIANHIFSEMCPLLAGINDDELKHETVIFTNGKKLEYPKWFINHRGHDLYTKFQYRYKKPVNYDNLIRALLRHEFIPVDLKDKIIEIQST